MRLHRIGVVIAALLGAATLVLAPAVAASADDSSTTTFPAAASQTVSYGTNWVMPITVAGSQSYDYVTPTSGTVNILIKGQPGNYATALPLTAGGVAYFSPPASQPALGAGSYEVTAVYVPSGTAYLTSSQTLTPAILTVTAIKLSTGFSVEKTTVANRPGAEVVTSITPPADSQSIPAGSWTITATDSSGAVAFHSTVARAANSTAQLTVPLGGKVRPGHKYTVSAKFAPNSAVAGGYVVSNAAVQTVEVEAESFAEVMGTPFGAPTWALIAIGLGLALLIAAGIVLLVRRNTAGKTAASESTPVGPASQL
jgi:hypothetical protein